MNEGPPHAPTSTPLSHSQPPATFFIPASRSVLASHPPVACGHRRCLLLRIYNQQRLLQTRKRRKAIYEPAVLVSAANTVYTRDIIYNISLSKGNTQSYTHCADITNSPCNWTTNPGSLFLSRFCRKGGRGGWNAISDSVYFYIPGRLQILIG